MRRVGDQASHRVDTRVIAATARDLETDAAQGRFREDLFYRLNVVGIRIPPLADRSADIFPLVRLLLGRHAGRLGTAVPDLEPEALRALLGYSWPGNVRELENALERALVLSRNGIISLADLPQAVRTGQSNTMQRNGLRDLSLRRQTGLAESETIRQALERTNGNRKDAARLLGVSVRTLFYKIKELGIADE